MLRHKYREELNCNELMLLPYYVASMNIEHAFWDATGDYEAFEGICLVDTFETAEKTQRAFDVFNGANTARVQQQRKAPIKVIVANPPYNAGQIQENDNNKNRKYEEIDRRVRVTYAADSQATLVRKLSDPYVKAIRFAADRIGDAGVVCYVNNDSFVAEKSFDGMRKHLGKDRDSIRYNEFLSLAGIPQETFDYRLGNRSALEWVIDQYRVTRDEHGKITSDPNRDDDEQYIVRLVGQVITVSLETRRIVAGLPPFTI